MGYHCFKCSAEIVLNSPTSVGRKDECDKCKADLHCCMNCVHFDRSCYNECRESQAERVLDKDRSNFCDYFSFRKGAASGKTSALEDNKKKLDQLFK